VESGKLFLASCEITPHLTGRIADVRVKRVTDAGGVFLEGNSAINRKQEVLC